MAFILPLITTTVTVIELQFLWIICKIIFAMQLLKQESRVESMTRHTVKEVRIQILYMYIMVFSLKKGTQQLL